MKKATLRILSLFFALPALMALAGCPKNGTIPQLPPTPQTPTSWKMFQDELTRGGYKLTTIGRGNLRPGSLVEISSTGAVIGTPWLQLGDCVKSQRSKGELPVASTHPAVAGDYTAGEAGGISISGQDLVALFGLQGGAESVRAGSFKLKAARWNTAEEGGYTQWISEHQGAFSTTCREGPKVAELHVVTSVFETDFEMTDLNFASYTASGFARVKELIALQGRAYRVKLSSAALSTQGNMVPMAARTVPLENLMTARRPTAAPFPLDDEDRKQLSSVVGGLTAGELWNDAFRVALSATFLVEPGTITAIMEVQGQLLKDAVNPGRISTGNMAGLAGKRIYLDGELKTPTHRVIAPDVEAAELEVGKKFELVVVAEFPYAGCAPKQAWEKLALPVTFKNTSYLQVQILSTTGAPKDAMVCATRGDQRWKAYVLEAESLPVKTGDLNDLKRLLESKELEGALVRNLSRISFAKSPGWVIKPKSAKLSDVLLAAFTCP